MYGVTLVRSRVKSEADSNWHLCQTVCLHRTVYIIIWLTAWRQQSVSNLTSIFAAVCKRSYSFFRGKWWFRNPGARLNTVMVFCHFYNSKAWVDFIVMKRTSGKFFQTSNFRFNRRNSSGLGMMWGWVNKERIISLIFISLKLCFIWDLVVFSMDRFP